MVNLDYLYNLDVAKRFANKSYFLDKKLGFQVIENGTILPHKWTAPPGKWSWGAGGIVDNEGNFVEGTHVHGGIIGSYPSPPESVQYSPKTVIYLGLFYPVWGHVISDNIRRIWFLQSDDFKSQFSDCSIVYVPWYQPNELSNKNFRRLLEILGVDVDKLQPIMQPTRFDKIILPDGSFGGGFTNEYRKTIERVRNFALKNQTPTSSKKIYYFYGRGQIGEERLAEYFHSKGYEIISPEKLPLEEQLNLLINTDSFASTIGSSSHNSIFLRDGTETIYILRAFNAFTGYQQILDKVHPLNVNYVDSMMSIFSKGSSDKAHCYILSKQLKQFFGDKFNGYEEEDFKIFLDYMKGPLRKLREVNTNLLKDPTFSDFIEQLKLRKDLIEAYDMPLGWDEFHPLLIYRTHIHKKGWGLWKIESKISNSLDKKYDIQAIKINFPKYKVYYSVYYNEEEGWAEEVTAPEQAGITGKRKSIFGIKIRLDEAGAKEFDILYRVHKFDDEWTHWAKNGEELISDGVKLNAIQIKLEIKKDVIQCWKTEK